MFEFRGFTQSRLSIRQRGLLQDIHGLSFKTQTWKKWLSTSNGQQVIPSQAKATAHSTTHTNICMGQVLTLPSMHLWVGRLSKCLLTLLATTSSYNIECILIVIPPFMECMLNPFSWNLYRAKKDNWDQINAATGAKTCQSWQRTQNCRNCSIKIASQSSLSKSRNYSECTVGIGLFH